MSTGVNFDDVSMRAQTLISLTILASSMSSMSRWRRLIIHEMFLENINYKEKRNVSHLKCLEFQRYLRGRQLFSVGIGYNKVSL